ncbi:MAG: hypothetical protein AB7U62_19195 [Pseudolabrys sp.]
MTDTVRPEVILRAVDRDVARDELQRIGNLVQIEQPTPLARAAGLWVLKRAFEREHPNRRHGGDRRSQRYREDDQGENFATWSIERGMQLAERTIRDDVKLAQDLRIDGIKALWSTPVAENAVHLKRVARLTDAARLRLFSEIERDRDASFGDWLQRAGLRTADDDPRQVVRRFADLWQDATSTQRREILDHIGIDGAVADAVIRRWQRRKSIAA